MKRILLVLTAAIFSTVTFGQIDHLEPPFWWAGMEHSGLQLMVHENDIGGSEVSINYNGIEIKSVSEAENNNYLFIDLEIDKEVLPGSFDIVFKKKGMKTLKYKYQLKQREQGSAQREGFNSSDVMYLVMPDRFANGDTSNDELKELKEGLNREERYGRHGGDIQGMIDRLDYISDMGFTALWLNPVLENDMPQWSYHGYAATDFYKVDRRFGTNEDYKKLGSEASKKGVKLIMDMIFNHCGADHWWMENPPFQNWINHYSDYVITNHRRTINQDPHASEADIKGMTDGWFVPQMPDMNQRNPFMAEYLIQNSIWWIEYVGLAGIRMDTYPYPDKYVMAEWNKRVLKEYPRFNIVGEEWSMNPAVVSYWQKGQTNKDSYDGEIPSMMDFPLQNAVAEALTEDEGWDKGLVKMYEALANDFLYPDPFNLVVFPDNHDMPRFYMQMNMDKDLFRNGMVYFLTTRGIPQIYYGTEILMTHTEGNDHGYIRKDFPGGWPGDKIDGFSGRGLTAGEAEMQAYIKKILNWRKTNSVIHQGSLKHFAPQNKTYVYFRYNEEKMVMVVINKNTGETDLPLERFAELLKGKSSGVDIISGEKHDLANSLRLKAVTPMILEIE